MPPLERADEPIPLAVQGAVCLGTVQFEELKPHLPLDSSSRHMLTADTVCCLTATLGTRLRPYRLQPYSRPRKQHRPEADGPQVAGAFYASRIRQHSYHTVCNHVSGMGPRQLMFRCLLTHGVSKKEGNLLIRGLHPHAGLNLQRQLFRQGSAMLKALGFNLA